MTDSGQAPSKRRGWWPLVAMGVVFALPITGAFFWQPTGYVNYGELVKPARPLQDMELHGSKGEGVRLSALQRKWTLLYVGRTDCAQACRDNLYKIQQVRLAQSKNVHRVQSLFVVPASMNGERLADLRRDFPGVLTLTAVPEAWQNLSKQLQAGAAGDDRVYVVDPNGNLMMSYPRDADPSGMRKDLNRLLKVSQIG